MQSCLCYLICRVLLNPLKDFIFNLNLKKKGKKSIFLSRNLEPYYLLIFFKITGNKLNKYPKIQIVIN